MKETMKNLELIKESLIRIDTIEELYVSGLLREEGKDKAVGIEKSDIKLNFRSLKMDIARILE